MAWHMIATVVGSVALTALLQANGWRLWQTTLAIIAIQLLAIGLRP